MMTDTPWTPGPWDFTPKTEKCGAYVTAECDDCTVADLYFMPPGKREPHHFREESDANARLIAASPELAMAADIAATALARQPDGNPAVREARIALHNALRAAGHPAYQEGQDRADYRRKAAE